MPITYSHLLNYTMGPIYIKVKLVWKYVTGGDVIDFERFEELISGSHYGVPHILVLGSEWETIWTIIYAKH